MVSLKQAALLSHPEEPECTLRVETLKDKHLEFNLNIKFYMNKQNQTSSMLPNYQERAGKSKLHSINTNKRSM